MGMGVLAFLGSFSASAETEGQRRETLYAYGRYLATTLVDYRPDPREQALVLRGFNDAMDGNVSLDLKLYVRRVDSVVQKIAARRNAAFLAQEARDQHMEALKSGILFKELKPGSGAQPGPTDIVGLRFSGRLMDGKEFEGTHGRGDRVAEFRVDGVVPCWTEVLQRMKVGEKARVVCPAELGYGLEGVPPRIPALAPLVFEMELVDTRPSPKPDHAPVKATQPPEWLTPPDLIYNSSRASKRHN